MIQKKRFVFALAVILLFALTGSAYAQEQIATLTPNPAQVASGGSFDVTLTYNTSDGNNVAGFGVMICFDSALVSFTGAEWLSAEAKAFLQSPDPPRAADDKNDLGGFGATGKIIGIVYMSTDSPPPFPGAALPTDLIKLNFTAQTVDSGTAVIKVKELQTAGGYTFMGTDATVKIGVVTPTATAIPIDMAAAMVTTGTSTIIDANAAAYANERMAGAVTLADVDLATLPKETEIMVYCRDAAVAKAEADNLAAQGFTNVYYLDDTFANFAADTTNVTDDMVQYKLMVTVVGTGTVTPMEGYFNRNEAVTLTADPAEVTWSDNAPGGVVTMDTFKTVTATFAQVCDLTAVAINAPTGGAEPWGETLSAVVTGTADTYAWTVINADGSTVATGSDTTLALSDLAAGTYTANLTVSNSAIANCSAPAAPVQLTVTGGGQCDLTSVAITGTSGEVQVGATVTLTATPTGTADTYIWEVKNAGGNDLCANTSVQPNVFSCVVTDAAQAGSYTPKVTASNSAIANCSLPQVSAAAITVPAAGCTLSATITGSAGGEEPLDVTLTATVTGGTADTYTWNVTKDGASVATGADSTLALTALAAGSYTVSLTVTNAACPNGVDAGTHLIQVSPAGGMPDGDGDCNDIVDIYDALLAAIVDAGNPDNVEVCDYDMLDVDQNGVVDINDALAIAKYDVGLTCTCVLDPKK